MTREPNFRRAFQRTLMAVAACSVVVAICYCWIDRPVAFFVERQELNKVQAFKWLTYPPPCVQAWSPLVLAALLIRRAWGPFSVCERTLLTACLSLIVADQFRSSLGDVCGRYWPETWFNHNPSLIGTGTYGFHPFQGGDDIGSFPSGHAARILGFAGVLWITVPRSRPILVLACLPMLVSLVAMNYHFVGDVIAGGVLGSIVALYATCLGNLGPCQPGSPGATLLSP